MMRKQLADTEKGIENMLNTRRGATVFTPNGEIIYKIRNDGEMKKSFESADLSLPDGVSVLLGARLLGYQIPSRLSGIDTAEFILELADRKKLSVYLLGGENGVADAAAIRLRDNYPSLTVSGIHHGFFLPDSDEEKQILREIRNKAPDILFVCLGAPAQEKWITKNSPTLPSLRLSMGLGGSLDVWSGNKKRAPRLFRSLGLEWLYRIFQSPDRIKRLPNLCGYFFAITEQAIKPRSEAIHTEKGMSHLARPKKIDR